MTSRSLLTAALAASLSLAACKKGGGSDGGGGGGPVTQPEGAIAVSFTVDDTANAVYGEGDLRWKGTFKYVESSRVVTLDTTGNGPFPLLWDDGPWDQGGHEPATEIAGDHRFGITVFIQPPAPGATSDLEFTYGLEDAAYAALPPAGFGTGMIGVPAGGFVVPIASTSDLVLDDLVFPAFGTTDLELVLDLSALATGAWDTSRVYVVGSAWPWADVRLLDDGLLGDEIAGDGKYTFLLSEYVGESGPFRHTGLLDGGSAVDFGFLLGADEYRDGGGVAHVEGVSAFTRPAGGAFTPATISIVGNETRVVVP